MLRPDHRRVPSETVASPGVAERRRLRFRRGLHSVQWRHQTLQTTLVAVGSVALFVVVYWLAFAFRFGFQIPPAWRLSLSVTLPWVVAVKLLIFYFSGQCRVWWWYVTFADFVALLRTALLSLAILAAIDHFLLPGQIPRAVLVLDCGMTILLLGAVRGSGRLVREHCWSVFRQRDQRHALLVGADRYTGLLAHQINLHEKLGHRIHGLLAVHRRTAGKRLGRMPVLGHIRDVGEIARAYGATEILVIAGSLSGRRMRWLMNTCDDAGLVLRVIPPWESLFNGDRWIPLRNLEVGDLLRRPPMEPDSSVVAAFIQGRRVLVTGAGGSIGSEICRQVLAFEPAELILVGRGENRIFATERELLSAGASTQIVPVIGCITDRARMEHVFDRYRPEVVFHAAAHKHVPLMETNVGEAIKNNVLGTKCVADLADEYDTKSFVLISTDKAVHPTSVLGATKRLAERYVHELATKSTTCFVAVRFGNVLGSASSVVPLFQQQIRRGGPITITDPRMTRFFMTVPEASHLVLQAAAMGKGGEIFVLDMGEQISIVDLAKDLIRLHGLPEHAIDIRFTGIRPGEKLHEELCTAREQRLPTSHPSLYQTTTSNGKQPAAAGLIAGLEADAHESDEVLRARLAEAVPEYQVLGAEEASPLPQGKLSC